MATKFNQPKDWTGQSWADAAKAYAGYWKARQSVSPEELYKQAGGVGNFNRPPGGRPDQTEEDEALIAGVTGVYNNLGAVEYSGFDFSTIAPGADHVTVRDWTNLENYLVEGVPLPDIETFDPAAFDPYAHIRGTAFEASETKRTAEDVYKKYGLAPIGEGALSQQALDDSLKAYQEAIVRTYVDNPQGDLEEQNESPTNTYARITDRNLLYAQYANLSKQLYNAKSAEGNASLQTSMLQNKMRGLIKGQGNFFENLKESAEADVRIGSNVQSQRKPKKTSRSTNAATARSKVLVRAPGINI